MTNLPIQGLPQANTQFTAIKGTGPVQHNLESQLHHRTLTGSSHLHPLKEHIKTISQAFNAPVFKRAIRGGGLNLGEQKLLKQHIFAKDKELAVNILKKTRLKELIAHYAAPGHGGGSASGSANLHGKQPLTKVQIVARRARMREQGNEIYQSHSAGTASQLGQHAVSSISQTQKSSYSIAGDRRGGYASDNTKKAVGSITQLVNAPKTAAATPPGKTFTTPKLTI
ncbi:MAG: hypothetical protein Q7K39_05235 [Candidatus Magasanikbacteria bacterium]|nr:hypothetical protein [Candidatus Magasanikbacteria bacterium]